MEVTHLQDKDALVPTSEFPDYAHFPFVDFNPPQSCVIDVFDQDANMGIAAATSAGKAQPLASPVLTPIGFIPMGQIIVGQDVIGSDGNPIKVTGVFPQGKKTVYRVWFSDKTFADCCEEHLWSVRTRSDKSKNKPFRIKPLKNLFGDLKDNEGQNKWFIPLMKPDLENCFTNSALPIKPYTLGVLLGDGGIKHRVILSSGDEEIIERVKEELPEGCLVEYIENYDYQIIGGMNEQGKKRGFKKTNLIKHILKELGLFGRGSCKKFIPQIYLNSNSLDRLELLRGLMDSDGTSNGVKAGEFTSCSKDLAEGVCQLARSLGAATKVRKNKSSYRDKDGNLINCKFRYRVTVNLGHLNPFSINRKKNKQHLNLKKGINRSIDRIEVFGIEECQCISVNSKDNLYVTNDYILTHNTVCAEMYMAHEIRVRGGKAMYLGTHKALVQEKLNDWTDFDHHFSDLNISICSGDYQLTDARKKELARADIICMTSEMLASRCRNFKSEKNNFLLELGTLIVDESHLLTVPGRGDHLEVALMKITEINPDVRIVLLSATMPNVVEICEWISFNLNKKNTYYLNSKYRPVPLDVHYPMYYDGNRRYDANESSKVDAALDIVAEYPDDKFLIFAHTKRTGEMMKTALKKRGVVADFHNANLSKARRTQIEQDFCNSKKDLRCVIATSTLAWGMNLPARRVIVLGVHRGLTEVDVYDVMQMVGRAGRPKFDKKGDAYILLPQTEVKRQKNRITNPVPITSQLLEHHKILAFHLVSEIHQRTVKTIDDIHKWYSRSLASYQSHDLTTKVDDTLEALMKCGAVVETDKGLYDVTSVGKIASMFYYSPFDVADLKRNFNGLFEKDKQDNDYWLSMALGNTDTNRTNIVTRADKTAMEAYFHKIEAMSRSRSKPYMEAAIKGGFAYHCLLTGNMPPALYSFAYGLKADFDRLIQVLNVLDSFSGQWEMKDWFGNLSKRVMYGVKPELMPLIEIAEVGKVRAEMLYEKNIRSAQDILDDPQFARAVLNVKPLIFDKIVESAQSLAWKAML